MLLLPTILNKQSRGPWRRHKYFFNKTLSFKNYGCSCSEHPRPSCVIVKCTSHTRLLQLWTFHLMQCSGIPLHYVTETDKEMLFFHLNLFLFLFLCLCGEVGREDFSKLSRFEGPTGCFFFLTGLKGERP